MRLSSRARQVSRLVRAVPALGLLLATGGGMASAQTVPSITPTEAEILLYVSPIAYRVRADGGDVAISISPLSSDPKEDFYFCQLHNYKKAHLSADGGLIGNFAVNKHTAEVWDDDFKRQLSGSVLKGVQNIIRRAHQITARTIARHSRKPPL